MAFMNNSMNTGTLVHKGSLKVINGICVPVISVSMALSAVKQGNKTGEEREFTFWVIDTILLTLGICSLRSLDVPRHRGHAYKYKYAIIHQLFIYSMYFWAFFPEITFSHSYMQIWIFLN